MRIEEKEVKAEKKCEKLVVTYSDGGQVEYDIVDGYVSIDFLRRLEVANVAQGNTIKVRGWV